MKKLFRNYKLPMLTALGAGMLLLGCTNADYDFDNGQRRLRVEQEA